MDREKIIRELRGILNDAEARAGLTSTQYDAIVAAIRALGGNP